MCLLLSGNELGPSGHPEPGLGSSVDPRCGQGLDVVAGHHGQGGQRRDRPAGRGNGRSSDRKNQSKKSSGFGSQSNCWKMRENDFID